MITQKEILTLGERDRILLQTSAFVCLRPHPALRAYISHYHITFPTKEIMPDGFTTMPDGCSSLNVFVTSQSMSIDLAGPTTRPSIVGSQANQVEMIVGIDFQPGGLYAFTGINQGELTDRTFSFADVEVKLSGLIAEAVEKCDDVYKLTNSLDALLLGNMRAACHVQIVPVFQHMFHCGGNTTMKELASHIHYSERQLSRIFTEHVGLSPKSFSRLLRIYRAFRMLKRPDYSLAMVSDMAGYYDLSHFIRDFALVCGVPPQTYRQNMSGFYTNTAKF